VQPAPPQTSSLRGEIRGRHDELNLASRVQNMMLLSTDCSRYLHPGARGENACVRSEGSHRADSTSSWRVEETRVTCNAETFSSCAPPEAAEHLSVAFATPSLTPCSYQAGYMYNVDTDVHRISLRINTIYMIFNPLRKFTFRGRGLLSHAS
jgi:hypothetical protein